MNFKINEIAMSYTAPNFLCGSKKEIVHPRHIYGLYNLKEYIFDDIYYYIEYEVCDK